MGFFGDGENARMIRLLTRHELLQKIDVSDPGQVQERINEYFIFCEKHNLIPQITGMSNWLGISRDTLNSWKRGEFPGRKEHQKIVEKAYSLIEDVTVSMLIAGRIPAASGIFLLKSIFGYADRIDIGLEAHNNPLSELNDEEARRRILEQFDTDGEGSDTD